MHATLLTKLKKSLTIIDPKPFVEIERQDVSKNVTMLFEHNHENKASYEPLLLERPDALFINGMKAIIKDFIREGTHYSETQMQLHYYDFDFMLTYYTGAYYESIIWWIQQGYIPAAEEMAKTIVELSMQGPYKVGILPSDNY